MTTSARVRYDGWRAVKENLEEEKVRKAISRKFQDKYLHLCKVARNFPLSTVLAQFANPKFDVSGFKIGPTHMKIVATMLVNNEHVSSLNVRDNCLGREGTFWVADLIPINRSITKFNLSENAIGGEGLQALVPAIIDNILITKLDLSGNELGDGGCKHLAELIEARTGLLDLRLHHNSIGERGAVILGDALAKNENIEKLDLSWNHIRGKGAISIALSLKTNKHLRRLNVAWNGFGKEGARALGEALPENSSLRELDITNNRIDANGMALFMIGLKENTTLEVLKLGKNPFNSDVAKHLLMILEKAENSAITNLELSDVAVDEDFAEVLDRLSAGRNFNVAHGKIVRKIHIHEQENKAPIVPPRDPLELMFDFKYEHGYRTLDLLIRMDKDHNMVIDKEEFKNGLLEMGIEANDDQIDDLMSKLDTNSDGSIDYSELVAGEKEYGSRTQRHINMAAMVKIRSLAQQMLRLRFQNATGNQSQNQSENADVTSGTGAAGKKAGKREKTTENEKTLERGKTTL